MILLKRKYIIIISIFLLFCACGTSAVDDVAIKKAVLEVLKKQQDDWNAGDIDQFMAGYIRSDSVRYASEAEVHYGWEATRERFHKTYPDRAAMGILTFSDFDIEVLSGDATMVFGRFHLKREADEPTGLFTLLFRKTDKGWQIVHDHTSRALE